MPKFTTVKPVPQSLFPTKDSLNEALEYARFLLPEADHNIFMQAMMCYHNTLIKEVCK